MSLRDCQHFLELASAALDGCVQADEQAQLNAHLAECLSCSRSARAYAAQRLALRKAPVPPVAAKLEAQVPRWMDQAERARRGFAFVRRAAVLVAVIGLGAWAVSFADSAADAAVDETVFEMAERLDSVEAARPEPSSASAAEPDGGAAKGAPAASEMTRGSRPLRVVTGDHWRQQLAAESRLIEQQATLAAVPARAENGPALTPRELLRCNMTMADASTAMEEIARDSADVLELSLQTSEKSKSLRVESNGAETESKKAELVSKRARGAPKRGDPADGRRIYVVRGPQAIAKVSAVLVARPEPFEVWDTALRASVERKSLDWSANRVTPSEPRSYAVFQLGPSQLVADEVIGSIESIATVELVPVEGNPDVGQAVIVVLDR
jgi:hypothetical protein